jgi:hypothetical protein
MRDQARQRNLKTMLIILSFFLVLFVRTDGFAQTILFQDDFSSGNADRWVLQAGWQVMSESGNLVLSGSQHSFATVGSTLWTNYSLTARVKLMTANSATHLNYRSQGCIRYYIGFNTGGMYLSKTYPCGTATDLATASGAYNVGQWYTVEVVGHAGNIKVYVDGLLQMDYTDPDPVLGGEIAFEVLDDFPVYFDDVVVATDEPLSATPWLSTGGPLGGLGYDVRIHPVNKSIMYVTDNYAGVARSDSGGQTWYQTNAGINVRGGTTGDAINIFSLTMDQNNPDIIWAGTNGEGSSFGVYKSTDGGITWNSKTTGMALNGEIGMVFRGFTIQQGNSDIVYAQAEIPTTIHGWEFNRVKGRVYKTIDGGANWSLIWQGDNLARYVIIDPGNPDVLYLSTGIFDREAYNSDCANSIFGGLGVLKSLDGGRTWSPVNNGLYDLNVGSLRMHPSNSQILFAATGNNSCSGGYTGHLISGLFKTIDGGSSWTKAIPNDIITTVNFSPSSPATIYAGSASTFYRSDNGGTTWTPFSNVSGSVWGPPGVRAGVPIDVTVDPDNPSVLYANNYGGGVFRSVDGAVTWDIWSKGFSGADIHIVHIPSDTPSSVYAIGRSGPYVSPNYGEDWVGLANGAATFAEWDAIASKPANSSVLLMSDEHQGVILFSNDGGNNFSEVLRQPDADAADPSKRQGFRGLAFAPSSPSVVYAGLSKDRGTFLSSSPLGTVVYKSQDGGMTFSPMPGALDGTNVRRLIVDPSNADIVYAATTNGVYKSTTGASNWALIGSLGSNKIEALAIDPQQPGYILVGEIFGGIWMSTNSGANWVGPLNTGFSSPNPYISSLVLDPVTQNTVYAGDLYSGVYRSTDHGNTWAPYPDWKMSGLTVRAVKDLAISGNVMYAATQGGGVFMFGAFRLSASMTGTGSGILSSTTSGVTCSSSACSGIVPGSTSVVVTADALNGSGSVFTSWSGCDSVNGGLCTVTMTSAKSVTATFTLKTNFNASSTYGQGPIYICFTDTSINNPTSWLWNFGDGSTSTLQNPCHMYKSVNPFTVTLTTTGPDGPLTMTKSNFVTVTPCGNDPVVINGTSVHDTSIQNVYNIATDNAVIQTQALDFHQSLNLQRTPPVKLQGGYGCDYLSDPGFTSIYGTVTVGGGAVTIENLIFR